MRANPCLPRWDGIKKRLRRLAATMNGMLTTNYPSLFRREIPDHCRARLAGTEGHAS